MLHQKYRQAALTYLIYGLVYMGGAIYVAEVGMTAMATERSGLLWFVLGGVVILVFPILIYKQFKWFTRVVAFLLVIRIFGLAKVMLGPVANNPVPLPGGGEIPLVVGAVGFLLVTLITCFMLARAAWDL